MEPSAIGDASDLSADSLSTSVVECLRSNTSTPDSTSQMKTTQQWGIIGFRDCGYNLGDIYLGSGSIVQVRRATRKADGQDIVVKSHSAGDRDVRRALRQELDLVSSFVHHAIVRAEALCESSFDTWLCLELCDQGDVLSYVREKGAFEEQEGRALIRQLAEGLHYLHNKFIVHTNLKPSKLLLNTGTSPHTPMQLKVSDFFQAKLLKQSPHISNCTPQGYVTCAITQEVQSPESSSEKVDVLACGLCVYYMLTEDLPDLFQEQGGVSNRSRSEMSSTNWSRQQSAPMSIRPEYPLIKSRSHEHADRVAPKSIRPEYPLMNIQLESLPDVTSSSLSPTMSNFVQQCIEVHAHRRPNMTDLLRHNCFT